MELQTIKGMEITPTGMNVLTTDGQYHEFDEALRPSYRATGHTMPQLDPNGNFMVFGSEQAATVLKEMITHAKKEAGIVTIPGPTLTVVGPARKIKVTGEDKVVVIPVKTIHPDPTPTRSPQPTTTKSPCQGQGCHGHA
ncbi:hypothetical protein ACFL2U_00490 [Patescibacteria group bacterium]